MSNEGALVRSSPTRAGAKGGLSPQGALYHVERLDRVDGNRTGRLECACGRGHGAHRGFGAGYASSQPIPSLVRKWADCWADRGDYGLVSVMPSVWAVARRTGATLDT